MGEIQIKRNRVHIDIKDGDTRLGEIVFNPDDTRLYQRVLDLMQHAAKGSQEEKAISEKLSAIGKLPDLESLEDFESAAELFTTTNEGLAAAVAQFDILYDGLNAAFGNGQDICFLFTDGDKDPSLLMPLIEAVTPYFEKSRKEKTEKYWAKK